MLQPERSEISLFKDAQGNEQLLLQLGLLTVFSLELEPVAASGFHSHSMQAPSTAGRYSYRVRWHSANATSAWSVAAIVAVADPNWSAAQWIADAQLFNTEVQCFLAHGQSPEAVSDTWRLVPNLNHNKRPSLRRRSRVRPAAVVDTQPCREQKAALSC